MTITPSSASLNFTALPAFTDQIVPAAAELSIIGQEPAVGAVLEATGTAAGQATVSGIGEGLGTQATGAAAGVATVQGVGDFLGIEATGTAAGQATVNGLGQIVGAGLSENPKSFFLRIKNARIGANGILEYDLVREDVFIYDLVAAGVVGSISGVGPQAGSPPSAEQDPIDVLLAPGSTRMVLLDIPTLVDQDDGPGFYAAAGAANEGWRGAVLYEKVGTDYTEIATFPERAVVGNASTALAAGATTLFDASGRTFVFDDTNIVDVTLLDGVSALESVSDADMLAGRNAAVLGSELILFGTATQIDQRKWRLSHLLRGMKGTEWAVGSHTVGERFVLLDLTLQRVNDSLVDLNVSRTFRALSVGTNFEDGLDQVFTDTGISLKPLSPVYIRGEEDSGQNRTIRWWRRSRLDGLAGREGVADPPLGEQSESYEVDILNAGGTTVLRTISTTEQAAIYTAAQQTADFGSVPSSLRVNIYQISAAVGRGYPGPATISSFDAAELPPIEEPPYDVAGTFIGRPDPGLVILRYPFPREVSFGAGLPNSHGVLAVSPSAQAVFSLGKNGIEFGTMTFAASSTSAVFSATADTTFSPGDVLTVVAPTIQDATLSDLGFGLAGRRIV